MKSLLLILGTCIALLGCQEARDARALKKQRKADAVPMSGMLTYKADAASWVDCTTSERFVVKFKGDWLAVERAYVNSTKPSEPVYVEFRGRTEADSTDNNIESVIVIEEITNMRTDTTCQK